MWPALCRAAWTAPWGPCCCGGEEPIPWMNDPAVTTEWYPWEYNASPPDLPELCEKKALRAVAHIYLPVMAVLFCVLGVLGNGVLLLVRTRYHTAQSLGDVLLLHLAASDLLLLLTLPVGVAGMVGSWSPGTGTCQALQGLHALNFYSGFLSLVGLTADRYVAIVGAPVAHRLHSSASCWGRLCSGLVWLLSAALALPHFLYARVEDYGGVRFCRVADVTAAISLVQVALGFVLPFAVMAACYTAIARALLASPCAQSLKALRLILALVLVFLALQLPYALLTALDTADLLGHQASSCKVILRRDLALLITSALAFARCCLNPVLHTFLGMRFRKDLQRLSRDLGCLRQWVCCGEKPGGFRRQASFTTHLEGISGVAP